MRLKIYRVAPNKSFIRKNISTQKNRYSGTCPTMQWVLAESVLGEFFLVASDAHKDFTIASSGLPEVLES